ncbi:helix-turn-helix domain-containing protein [Streptomyces sp. NBC_01264]|uniref:helix-turn-helix domain-containing protein n=1 Tax=Streptomyces sp. NBC_01264 TaxID=2903804 RepID=UPI00338E0D83
MPCVGGPLSGRRGGCQTAGLFDQVVRQAEVARLLGVSGQAVGQWHTAWREGGREALVARSDRTHFHLTEQQEQELLHELRHCHVVGGGLG